MSRDQAKGGRPPKGVTVLGRARGGRRFLARIRRQGVEIHLGLYETAGQAAFAFNVAADALGRGDRPPNPIERADQPDADQVRRITTAVRRRLGLDPPPTLRHADEIPPDPDQLLTLFEVTVVGFWQGQAAGGDAGDDLDAAGRRLAESARLVFWSPSRGHPSPADAMARLLARRIDGAFRRADVTRAILDDDRDEDWRVARWLVLPDVFPAGRGFRDEVRFLYPVLFLDDASSPGSPHWAGVLGVDPPYSSARVRDAYRTLSKAAHPDAGGSHAAFIRLQAAYDEAREYCRVLGI